MRTSHVLILVGCLVLSAGCSSTREVETSRPRAYQGATETENATPRQARLSVFLAEGETELPDGVSTLRFRVAEVRLHERDGDWIRLPSDASQIELVRGRSMPRKLVLDTRVPPSRYDSLAIALDGVFVRFNENAGAPLTTAKDAPQRFAFSFEPELESQTALTLMLESGASLTRSPDCRWFFVPLFETNVAQ